MGEQARAVQPDDELRALRERAYGPQADIHDDPDAVRRLEELEEAARPAPVRDAAVEPGEPADPVAAVEGGAVDAAGEEPEPRTASAEPASPAPEGYSRRVWRWMPALWVASILVTAAIAFASTIGWAMTTFAPIAHAPARGKQLAVLKVHTDPITVSFLGPGKARTYGDFHGVTVLEPEAAVFGFGSGTCLVIVPTQDITAGNESFSGPLFYGCSAGAFPAIVQVPVSADLPASLTSLIPVGRGLQFVRDGTRVGIYADH